MKSFDDWWTENHRGMSDTYLKVAAEAWIEGMEMGIEMSMQSIRKASLLIEKVKEMGDEKEKG